MRIEKLLSALRSLANICNFKIDEYAINRYVEFLSVHPEKIVFEILESYFDSQRWPSIMDLKGKLGVKTLDADQQARLVEAEIETAIRKYGWCNEKDAMASLSPVAKAIVVQHSWQAICNVSNEQLSFSKSSWRALAKTYIESGNLPNDPQLPSGSPSSVKALTDSLRDPSKRVKLVE